MNKPTHEGRLINFAAFFTFSTLLTTHLGLGLNYISFLNI